MWRSNLEDKYTVKCKNCGFEFTDTNKKPNQKYLQDTCINCGYTHKSNKKEYQKYILRCKKCGYAYMDTEEKPNQKYFKEKCPNCGYTFSKE